MNCTACFGQLLPMPLRRDGRAISYAARRRRRGVVPVSRAVRAYAPLTWITESWQTVLGRLPGHKPASVLINGPPGSGKSTVSGALAADAVAAGKTALYVAAENSGAGPALWAIFRRAGATEVGENLLISDAESPREVTDDLLTHEPDLAIIDSVQAVRALPADITEWLSLTTTLVLVSHVNTQGRNRGGPELEHLVDVVVRMEPSLGAVAQKSRFGATPGQEVLFEALLHRSDAQNRGARVVQLEVSA